MPLVVPMDDEDTDPRTVEEKTAMLSSISLCFRDESTEKAFTTAMHQGRMPAYLAIGVLSTATIMYSMLSRLWNPYESTSSPGTNNHGSTNMDGLLQISLAITILTQVGNVAFLAALVGLSCIQSRGRCYWLLYKTFYVITLITIILHGIRIGEGLYTNFNHVFYHVYFMLLTLGMHASRLLHWRHSVFLSVGFYVEYMSVAGTSPDSNILAIDVIVMTSGWIAAAACGFVMERAERNAYAMSIHLRAQLKAREAAEKVAQDKVLFVANMSHEIRTPLTALMGFMRLLHDTELSAEQAELLKPTQTASKMLKNIIDDILDHLKLEHGKMEIVPSCVRTSDMIQNVVDLFLRLVEDKGLYLRVHIASDVPAYVMLDSGRVAQMLSNFLSNALKFTDTGGIIVKVKSAVTASGDSVTLCTGGNPNEPANSGNSSTNNFLFLSVTDTGVGIRQQDTHKLFQSFTQAHEQVARKYGGTGLGLSIVKNLAFRMSGKVGMESKIGVGSTFWCTFQAPPVDALAVVDVEQPQELKPNRRVTIRPSAFDTVRVVAVDDQPINLMLLKAQISQLGCQGILFDSAPKAIDYLRGCCASELPHLILMDFHMPEMNGIEATERIKKDLGIHKIPIYGLSAETAHDQVCMAREAGMESVFMKPMDALTLKRLLSEVMGQVSDAAAAADDDDDRSTRTNSVSSDL